ncbi:MAG: NAD-dependent epimerase/dehydratase family protein [Parcubacteria group bacterium]|nr:NAD-dependent epimerase/dehydratase family protein [Parcubacteria group bacterium]
MYVFHIAALPRVMPSIQDPRTTHDVNVTGTLNVFLLPSPLHPYGLQKYMGEQLAGLFSNLYNMRVVSLRYFNVYGERAPLEGAYAQVIGRFLQQKKEDRSLTIVPDGKQTRDFTHVKDVVRANILAAESENIASHEVINIGGGKNYTVLEIADMIGGERIFIEPRVEGKHTFAGIQKAKQLLNWKPEIALTDGIAELKKLYL